MRNLQALALVVVLSSALIGCTSDSTEASLSKSADKTTTAQSAGKPSAPITMHYQLLTDKPKAGETIEVAVSFESPRAEVVSSQLVSAENLTWLNSEKDWQSTRSKTGQFAALPTLKVVAPKDGIYYLRFVAEVTVDGVIQGKPFTIVLQVGNGPFTSQTPGEIITDDKGQKIIIQQSADDNH